MNTKGAMAIAAVTFGLSACTTLGTNVSGKFRCEAADGICAPSLVIDDSAIARIEETTSADLVNPAGPFRMDDGISAPVRSTRNVCLPSLRRTNLPFGDQRPASVAY